MERIRIDRRDQRLRARARAAGAAELTPLVCRTGDGPAIDEELLARIDALIDRLDRPGRIDCAEGTAAW